MLVGLLDMMYYRLKQYIAAVPGFGLILHPICFTEAFQEERKGSFVYSPDSPFDCILQPEALATEATTSVRCSLQSP